MAKKVYILGGYQTDFAEHYKRAGKDLYDLLTDSVVGALEKTDIAPKEIQSAHIGNFVSELFCGQGQLGGLFVSIHPDLAGIPTARHEAACASGSMAVFNAMAEIEAERYDLVCVSGVEMMRNVGGKEAAEHLGAAAWIGREAQDAQFPWPYLFNQIGEMYAERYGLKAEHLAEIAKINYANAKNNPKSQTRTWNLAKEFFTEDDQINPVIEGTLRKSDCGRITDGGATIFLASEAYAKKYAAQRNIDFSKLPYIKGWGHRTAPMLLADKLEAGKNAAYPFPHLRGTIEDAYKRANISGVSDLDAIETHDCFTITEYVALEHFGLTTAGEGWKAIEAGTINMAGSLPVNPSGGLIANGHPVGATGIRMLLDAYKQVMGTAGNYQVEGAKNVATLNVGGSLTTMASFIVGKN
ncbi:MAG: acetyl-CoA acetyltransferase [Bacteroidota bacterium]